MEVHGDALRYVQTMIDVNRLRQFAMCDGTGETMRAERNVILGLIALIVFSL